MTKTLMQRLIEAGYPEDKMYFHESDLYVFVCGLTSKVVRDYCKEYGLDRDTCMPSFVDQVTGKLMYDCAFQNDNFWKEKMNETVC